MQKESNDSVVYVPTMHREFFPEGFAACVRPVWPGLPDGGEEPDKWYPTALPYTPREAAACLAELAQMDEAGLASLSEAAPSRGELKARQERQDLKSFARTGERQDVPRPVSAGERGRWAQRFLLLGWLQEERVLDMERLAARYRMGAEKLASRLGSEEGAEDVFSDLIGMMRELVPDEAATLLPSWRFMLDLLAILLPEDCVLCTADARMGGALAESGLCLEPLSPEVLARLPQGWRAPEGCKVTCGEEPLWKLLGKKGGQSDRPWLDRRQLLILCRTDDSPERT